MAIRTLVAAAALVAFTAPAFADTGENIAILDDTVSTGEFAFAFGPAIAAAGIALFVIIAEDGKVTPTTTN